MTPKLIKTIDEVLENVPVAMTSTFGTVAPYLYAAERTYIRPIIGAEQYDALAAAFENNTTEDPLATAIKLAQRVIANLGYFSGIAVLSVTITGNGIQIMSSADTKNAFQWQVEDVKDTLQELGFAAIEEFLEYLEENPEAFTEYITSEEYQARQSSLIRTAADFTNYYDINGSRFIYQRILSIMKRVEMQTMIRVLGDTFYKSLMQPDLPAKKQILVNEYLKPGLALLTAAKAFVERVITLEGAKVAFNFRGNYNNMKESMAASRDQVEETRKALETDGSDFIQSGLEYINDNRSDFSDFITPAVKRRARFTNDPCKGVFGI